MEKLMLNAKTKSSILDGRFCRKLEKLAIPLLRCTNLIYESPTAL